MKKKKTPSASELALMNTPSPSTKKEAVVAGSNSVKKAIKKRTSDKKHTVALKLTDQENDLVMNIANRIAKHGVQVSKGNAIRLALELLDPSESQIKDFAERIASEDKRKQR